MDSGAHDQEQKLVLQASPDCVFHALTEIFQRHSQSYKVEKSDRLARTFLVTSAGDWKSWGKSLQISIFSEDSERSEVLMKSKPKFDLSINGLWSKYELAHREKSQKEIEELTLLLTETLHQNAENSSPQ